MIFHHFWTPKKHPKSSKKLQKVTPRELFFSFQNLSLTLGSQSTPQDEHFDPPGPPFGPFRHRFRTPTLNNFTYVGSNNASKREIRAAYPWSPRRRCPKDEKEVSAHRCRSIIGPHRFLKNIAASNRRVPKWGAVVTRR